MYKTYCIILSPILLQPQPLLMYNNCFVIFSSAKRRKVLFEFQFICIWKSDEQIVKLEGNLIWFCKMLVDLTWKFLFSLYLKTCIGSLLIDEIIIQWNINKILFSIVVIYKIHQQIYFYFALGWFNIRNVCLGSKYCTMGDC